jgi:hypothetical protein
VSDRGKRSGIIARPPARGKTISTNGLEKLSTAVELHLVGRGPPARALPAPQHERVMLPLTVLRRFDAVLSADKDAVLARYQSLKGKGPQLVEWVLNEPARDEHGGPLEFHNDSQSTSTKLKGDPDNIGCHRVDCINGFSSRLCKYSGRERKKMTAET